MEGVGGNVGGWRRINYHVASRQGERNVGVGD